MPEVMLEGPTCLIEERNGLKSDDDDRRHHLGLGKMGNETGTILRCLLFMYLQGTTENQQEGYV
jgi:hypothetical protein